MSKAYIYLIAEHHDNPLVAIDAAFDSQEKAQAYLDRYKDNEAEMFVCEVNPEYHTEQTSNCYYVELGKDSEVPKEVMISNKMASAKMAVNDMIQINPNSMGKETIEIYLFATSEEEAISHAIIRRDKAIALGEW